MAERHITPRLEVTETRQGKLPGDTYVKRVRPYDELFERGQEGGLVATERTVLDRPGWTRALRRVRTVLIGRPISSEREEHERLTKLKALAIFSSDNISSSAYATEEMMRILVIAGIGAISLTMPLTIAICTVLAIVATSYWQTIRAYPKGASSYLVASDNLGSTAGLVAGASLLIDYTLTVAVSVSAAVAAITSVVPELFPERVLIAVLIVLVLMLGNLRGIRESGTIFMAPTYLYIGAILAMVGIGVARWATGSLPDYTPPTEWLSAESGGEALGHLPHPARIQLGRCGADRRRGDLGRRPGLQAAGVEECPDHARLGRCDLRRALPGHQLHGFNARDRARPDRGADGAVADRAAAARRRVLLHRHPGRDRSRPGAGREHRVRRLPAPLIVHGARQLHATPVRVPRRAPGIHHRHRRAVRTGRVAARRLRRERHGADPALHARCLPGLHAVAVEHGRALVAAPRGRLAAGDRSSTGLARSRPGSSRSSSSRASSWQARGWSCSPSHCWCS